MTIKVNFPRAGMGIDEGMISRWLKRVGENVKAGEVLVEIEVAKAVQEVRAPVSGTLTQILVGEGETVPVNSTLALLEEPA